MVVALFVIACASFSASMRLDPNLVKTHPGFLQRQDRAATYLGRQIHVDNGREHQSGTGWTGCSPRGEVSERELARS
jgi:hypothetical protein